MMYYIKKKKVLGYKEELRTIETFIDTSRKVIRIKASKGLLFKKKYDSGELKLEDAMRIDLTEEKLYKEHDEDCRPTYVDVYRIAINIGIEKYIIDEIETSSIFSKNVLVKFRKQAENLAKNLKIPLRFVLGNGYETSMREHTELNLPYFDTLYKQGDFENKNFRNNSDIKVTQKGNYEINIIYKQPMYFCRIPIIFVINAIICAIAVLIGLNYGLKMFHNNFIKTSLYFIVTIVPAGAFAYFILRMIKYTANLKIDRVYYTYMERFMGFTFSKKIPISLVEEIIPSLKAETVILFTDNYFYKIKVNKSIIDDFIRNINVALYKLFKATNNNKKEN